MRIRTLSKDRSFTGREPETKESPPTPPFMGHPVENQDLLHAVIRILSDINLPTKELDARISELTNHFGDGVHSELLFLLTHLRFSSDEAREHWNQILAIRDSMKQKLAAQVDVRVAIVNYFVDINKKLESPKIIELKLFEQTQSSVYRDDLTSLYNYRYLRELLPREIQRVDRYDSSVAVVMLDVDDFKAYNDGNGHQAGNEALTEIATILADSVRDVDAAIRYGGEEFVLVLPSTTKKGAAQVAQRSCSDISSFQFPYETSQPERSLTVSAGVAVYPGDAETAEELVRCADRAMYVAKSQGKNCVSLFGESERTHSRIDATIDGEYCSMATEFLPLTTVNISEGGFLFIANQKLALESMLDVKLDVGKAEPILCTGRVVRVEELPDGQFNAAIRIMHIDDKQRRRLMKLIRSL